MLPREVQCIEDYLKDNQGWSIIPAECQTLICNRTEHQQVYNPDSIVVWPNTFIENLCWENGATPSLSVAHITWMSLFYNVLDTLC